MFRANVTLTNPVDGDDEVIDVVDKMGLSFTSSWHSLVGLCEREGEKKLRDIGREGRYEGEREREKGEKK